MHFVLSYVLKNLELLSYPSPSSLRCIKRFNEIGAPGKSTRRKKKETEEIKFPLDPEIL